MHVRLATVGLALAALVPVAARQVLSSTDTATPRGVPFDDARLKIEYNSTDGDKGLQFFVDAKDMEARDGHEPGGSARFSMSRPPR